MGPGARAGVVRATTHTTTRSASGSRATSTTAWPTGTSTAAPSLRRRSFPRSGDWRATTGDILRDSTGLSGPELEHWQLESVLRRTAQTVGQWLGTNYETLPHGTAAQFSSLSLARAAGPWASAETP